MSESKYRALLVEFVDLLSKRDMPGELALLGLSERIEAALAEPPVQAEPVAWLNVAADSVTNQLVVVMDWDDEGDEVQSRYLHPPAAQPNQHSRDSKELRDLCSQRGVPEGKEFSQFLSAVMTAAGLVRHGRQSKELSEYLWRMCMQYMTAAPSAGSQGGDV